MKLYKSTFLTVDSTSHQRRLLKIPKNKMYVDYYVKKTTKLLIRMTV